MTVPSPKRLFPRPSHDALGEPPYKRAKTHHPPHSVLTAQPCGHKTASAPIPFLPACDQSPRPLTSCASNFNEVPQPQVSLPSPAPVPHNPHECFIITPMFPTRLLSCLVHQSCRALSQNRFCSMVSITRNDGLIIPDLTRRSLTSKACFRFLSIIERRKVSIMPVSLAIPPLSQEGTPLQRRTIYPKTTPSPLHLPTLLPLPPLLNSLLQ